MSDETGVSAGATGMVRITARRYTARGLDDYVRSIDVMARKLCEMRGYDWSRVKRHARLIPSPDGRDIVEMEWGVPRV